MNIAQGIKSLFLVEFISAFFLTMRCEPAFQPGRVIVTS